MATFAQILSHLKILKYPEQTDFAERDAEKKVLRELDSMVISNGVAVKSLPARNFMLSGIDISKVVAIAPEGNRFSHLK